MFAVLVCVTKCGRLHAATSDPAPLEDAHALGRPGRAIRPNCTLLPVQQGPALPGRPSSLGGGMNPVELVPALAFLAVFTRELMWLLAFAMTISNLDDLAIDLLWLGGVAFRAPEPLPPPPAVDTRFAIFIPAWDESAVIGAMLGRLLQTLDYPHYRVFVGVYPNDPETRAAAEQVSDPRLVVISTGNDGPTTKADCLNAIWHGMVRYEQEHGVRFGAVVLHDAEDVLHPRELDVFNRYLPNLAMVQLPVLPISDPKSRWISGHYIDEFAQNHGKDMLVRALLNTPIPSAGVGSAIDRDALGRISTSQDGPFDASSLTEDYEIGHKLHRLGLRGRLVRHHLDGKLVAVQEYFPATLETAVRQKSRWLTGIALAGWDRIGWHGPWRVRWMLLRDRKGLLAAFIGMLGYALAALSLGQIAVRALVSEAIGAPLPPLLGGAENQLLRFLLIFNAVLLAWRLLVSAFFTARTLGLVEGLRTMVRPVVANVINVLAASRAIARYRESVMAGRQPIWEKTAHRFPTAIKGNMRPVTSGE